MTTTSPSQVVLTGRAGAQEIIDRLRALSNPLTADSVASPEQRAQWKEDAEKAAAERKAVRDKAEAEYDGRYDARMDEIYEAANQRELTGEELWVVYNWGRAMAYEPHFIARQLYKMFHIETFPMKLWFK